MVNPSGSDFGFEYIELRGDPGATIAADTYLIQVEGDENDPGDIESNGDSSNGCTVNNDGVTPCPQGGIIDLSGVTIGSNGFVVILTTGHDYTVNPDATILFDVTDGDLEGQSHSFLLVNTNGNGAPSSSDDIDDNDDGEIDTAFTDIWTFIDGVAFIDDDDATEYAYADVIFAESAAVATLERPSTATVISTPTQYDYAARIGNSTGSVVNNDASVDAVDWVGGDVPSSTTSPRVWNLGSNSTQVRTHPESWEGSLLNHIGGPNPTQNTLSTQDLTLLGLSIYPNPADDFITVESNNIEISSINIYDVLGKNVLSQKELTNNRVDVSDLNEGVYFMKIDAGNTSATQKIIIK
ncbi:T9SS type A sorting domain-containing protein [Winogradskyella sp. E313]|uniref:T9SS type A sorting domain-containing protein n=2 Tax=Winogradskyella immobilis TaxID=2816852 RepID=A0ABS8ELP9_9FLAO|nr:T9SS type A sorting domain-containing protein [Winogradskyella immobilis]